MTFHLTPAGLLKTLAIFDHPSLPPSLPPTSWSANVHKYMKIVTTVNEWHILVERLQTGSWIRQRFWKQLAFTEFALWKGIITHSLHKSCDGIHTVSAVCKVHDLNCRVNWIKCMLIKQECKGEQVILHNAGRIYRTSKISYRKRNYNFFTFLTKESYWNENQRLNITFKYDLLSKSSALYTR